MNLIKEKMMIVIALLIFGQLTVFGQQYTCSASAGISYLVTAASGLSMRAEPDLRAVKLKAVPYGKEVVVCPEFAGPAEQIEGTEGTWLRTYYRGEEGYMFSGFMEAQPEVKVVLPESWLDDGRERVYHGLYRTELGDGFTEESFSVRPVNMITDTVQIIGEEPYTYQRIALDDRPVFLFSGINTKNDRSIKGKQLDHKFLYPGESVSLTLDNGHYHIYAKGRVLENKTGEDINPISMIKNYELHVRRSGHDGDREDQIIYKMDIPSWYMDGYQGGVFIHWMGDLDEDGELDLLLSKSENPECWDIIFFLSSKAEHGHFFKQVTKYQECGGC